MPQVLNQQGLADFSFSLAADRQRSPCPNCHSVALSDSESLAASVRYIADRWPFLQTHIREAILTLVNATAGEVFGGHEEQNANS